MRSVSLRGQLVSRRWLRWVDAREQTPAQATALERVTGRVVLWSKFGLVAYPFAAFGLWVIGAGCIDAALLSVPFLLPAWHRLLPPPRGRSLVRFELPVLATGCAVLGLAMAGWNANVVAAPLPWGSGLAFGGYVLAWTLALRIVRDGAQQLVLRWLRDRHFVAGAAASLLTLGFGFPQLYVGLQTHRVALPQRPSPDLDGLPVRIAEVEFATRDGVLLRGTLLRQVAAAPVIVVCHGVGANRANFFGIAETAASLGCHALAFDFRAHGESGGWVSTFGAREVLDVVAAVDWLRADPQFAGAPVVLAGVSMGAATVLRAAKEVGAAGVLAESSFADLVTMLDGQVARLGPVAPLVTAAISWAARVQVGVDLAAISPRASLGELPIDVPVVLLHAGQDQIVPIEEGRRLAAVRAGARLEVFFGAMHGGCAVADPARFRRLLGSLVGR